MSFSCLYFGWIFHFVTTNGYSVSDKTHNESCYLDTQCPGQNMLCKVGSVCCLFFNWFYLLKNEIALYRFIQTEPGSINLCVCGLGYTFSHVFARCEPSRNIFRNFRIDGPTRINLTNTDVYFRVKFLNPTDGTKKWKYEWIIQDGHQFSTFSHLNESTLALSNVQ